MHGGVKMKKLLIALLAISATYSARADNYVVFKSDVVERAINQLVASENRQMAADEYQNNMNQDSGQISVMGLYKVCIASGFDIQTNDGYALCRNFLNFMISETENMGVGIASQQNCANQFNGVWTISSDGTTYQCVGRDGYELVYKRSCSGAGGECIKQFADLQTQGSNGREFINAYGKLHGLNLTCHSVTETRRRVANLLGQDYIKCSAGGRAYEFEFDDLNQTPGDKSSHSENTAICELYGGKIVDTGDKNTESIWQSCDISSELCNGAVRDLAMRTGHTVQYQGYCRLSRKAKVVSVVDLHQIDGIDSRIFYNAGAQMRMDTAKPMVEEYLRTKFPNETYIVCDTNPRELNQGLGVDIDYVMSCTVGTQRVDFVFDDLSESFDSDAATGMDIMQCIINGGTFNGETCRGLTESECDALDAKLRASGSENGADYDDDMRACVLGNAMATYQRNVVAGYVIGAVVIVGGTVLTIASGGAAAPVVINGVAMLATDIGINYAIDANHRRLSEKAAKKFVDFVTDADACTTEQCALEVLEKHYATLSGVMSDLNTDDTAVVDETMDRLIGLIQTEFVACGKDNTGKTIYASPADCAIQSSKLTLLDYIDPYSEAGLAIGSVIFDPGYVVTRFMRLKKVTKVADAVTDAARATNKADDVTDVSLKLKREEIRDALANANKIPGTDSEIQIPRGQLAAAERLADGSVVVIAKSKYTIINKLDDIFVKYLNKDLSVDLIDDTFVYRLDNLSVEQLNWTKRLLTENHIPYASGNGSVFIYEFDIRGLGKEVDATLNQKLNDIIRQEKLETALNGGEISNKTIIQTSKRVIEAFNDNIYLEDLKRVANSKRTTILQTVANDRDLKNIALNFGNATLEQKQKLAQAIVDRLEPRGMRVQVRRTYSAAGEQKGTDIFIGLNHTENSNLDGFINTLAHEHNHAVNQFLPQKGALQDLPPEILDRTVYDADLFREYFPEMSDSQINWHYINSLDEQSSYYIGDFVGDGFMDDLMNL